MDADVVINVEPAAEAVTDSCIQALAATESCGDHGRSWEAMIDPEKRLVLYSSYLCVKTTVVPMLHARKSRLQITCLF